jgi:hypothetical protein
MNRCRLFRADRAVSEWTGGARGSLILRAVYWTARVMSIYVQ